MLEVRLLEGDFKDWTGNAHLMLVADGVDEADIAPHTCEQATECIRRKITGTSAASDDPKTYRRAVKAALKEGMDAADASKCRTVHVSCVPFTTDPAITRVLATAASTYLTRGNYQDLTRVDFIVRDETSKEAWTSAVGTAQRKYHAEAAKEEVVMNTRSCVARYNYVLGLLRPRDDAPPLMRRTEFHSLFGNWSELRRVEIGFLEALENCRRGGKLNLIQLCDVAVEFAEAFTDQLARFTCHHVDLNPGGPRGDTEVGARLREYIEHCGELLAQLERESESIPRDVDSLWATGWTRSMRLVMPFEAIQGHLQPAQGSPKAEALTRALEALKRVRTTRDMMPSGFAGRRNMQQDREDVQRDDGVPTQLQP